MGEEQPNQIPFPGWDLLEIQDGTEKSPIPLNRAELAVGGYGYMREYPIARAYLDARVQTIYGGTTAIMKEIIGSKLGV